MYLQSERDPRACEKQGARTKGAREREGKSASMKVQARNGYHERPKTKKKRVPSTA